MQWKNQYQDLTEWEAALRVFMHVCIAFIHTAAKIGNLWKIKVIGGWKIYCKDWISNSPYETPAMTYSRKLNQRLQQHASIRQPQGTTYINVWLQHKVKTQQGHELSCLFPSKEQKGSGVQEYLRSKEGKTLVIITSLQNGKPSKNIWSQC